MTRLTNSKPQWSPGGTSGCRPFSHSCSLALFTAQALYGSSKPRQQNSNNVQPFPATTETKHIIYDHIQRCTYQIKHWILTSLWHTNPKFEVIQAQSSSTATMAGKHIKKITAKWPKHHRDSPQSTITKP